MAETHALSLTTTSAISARPDTVLVVPLGSCEQHGAHLPLGTDTIIAEYLCEQLAAVDSSVVVAPAIAISASGEHAAFPGTLSIGTEVLGNVLIELARSADWATAVVFINGHGGNADAVGIAVGKSTAEGRNVAAWWPSIPDADAHAGCTETSMMLAIAPHLVDMTQARVGNTTSLAELAGTLRLGGVHAVSPNGVLGDPRDANAKQGKIHLERLVQSLHNFVTQHRTRMLPS